MLAVIHCKKNRLKQIFSNLPALQQKLISQFAGFMVSGGIATSIHYLILIILVEYYLLNPICASGIGFLFGAISGFYLNRKFVFVDPTAGKIALLKYIAMASVGAILNLSLLWIFNQLLHMYYLIAQVMATISVMTLNFICCKLWIFKKKG